MDELDFEPRSDVAAFDDMLTSGELVPPMLKRSSVPVDDAGIGPLLAEWPQPAAQRP